MVKLLSKTMAILIFIVGFLGCANLKKFQYVNPEYADQKIFSTSVLLLPLSDDIIPVKDKVKLLQKHKKKYHMFSQQEKKYFNNYFAPTFSEIITAKVHGIDPQFKLESIEFDFQELKKEGADNGFKMFVPQKGKVKYNDFEPNYVIFFEDLYFDKSVSPDGGGLGRGSSSSIDFESGLKYLIWDNKQEKIAAYGRLEKDFKVMKMPSKTKYIEVFEDYIKKIVLKSPFRSRLTLK